MQLPILFGIHVSNQPRPGLDCHRAEAGSEVPHAPAGTAQRGFHFDQRISMVHRAQGFDSPIAVSGDAADGRTGRLDQTTKESGFEVGKVAGRKEHPIRVAGGEKRGVQSGHRSASGNDVGDHGQPQVAVPRGIAQQGHRSGGFQDLGGHGLDQGLTAVFEQCLVASHTAALSSRQDEARDSTAFGHERIIASARSTATPWFPVSLPVYWMRNRVFGNCLKQIGTLAMMMLACTAGFAQSGRTASTVAADWRTGRLVRTVIVAPRVVEPKVIEPVEVGAPVPAGPEASINELVEESARNHGVDPLLVHSVIKAESNYNPRAVSNKGAQGLMQLMPATARDLGVKNPMNPKENIEGGVKYLKYLQNQFSDPALALAAYNAGEGAVRRYNWIPPYPETQDYVVKVARNYRQAKAAAAVRAPLPKAASAAAPAVAKQETPAETPPAPLQYYYDAQGRLTLRTVK